MAYTEVTRADARPEPWGEVQRLLVRLAEGELEARHALGKEVEPLVLSYLSERGAPDGTARHCAAQVFERMQMTPAAFTPKDGAVEALRDLVREFAWRFYGDELCIDFRPHVERYMRSRVNNREDAAELAGDVIVRILERFGQFDPKRGPFAAWAYGIARNLLVDWYRRNARLQIDAFGEAEVGQAGYSDHDVFTKHFVLALLRPAIGHALAQSAALPAGDERKLSFEEMRTVAVHLALLKDTGQDDYGLTALTLDQKMATTAGYQSKGLRKLRLLLAEQGYRVMEQGEPLPEGALVVFEFSGEEARRDGERLGTADATQLESDGPVTPGEILRAPALVFESKEEVQ